jgi:hypothetical protein
VRADAGELSAVSNIKQAIRFIEASEKSVQASQRALT